MKRMVRLICFLLTAAMLFTSACVTGAAAAEDAQPAAQNEHQHGVSTVKIIKSPTCTEPGERVWVCDECGETYRTEIIPPSGHGSNDGIVTKAATCKQEGERTYTCYHCGEVIRTEAIPRRAEHDWDLGKVTKAATPEAEGEMLFTCKSCGDTKTEPTPKLAVAETGSCGENVTYTLWNSGLLEIAGDGPMAACAYGESPWFGKNTVREVKIGKGVTTIPEGAFSKCAALQSVSVPDSVTEIVYAAFSQCTALESVDLPDSVIRIGEMAFSRCAGLQSVRVPDGVTEIVYAAFSQCTALESVDLPDSVISIGSHVFYGCGELEEIALPDSVIRIGRSAFSGCKGLKKLSLPDRLTAIDPYTFYGCEELAEITWPRQLETIGEQAFSSCGKLKTLTLPDTVTSIGAYAFYRTAWLEEQPDGLVYIGNVLYQYKGDMPENTEVTVKPGTVRIAPYAFRGCEQLTGLTLPEGLLEIGDSALYDCRQLAKINFPDSIIRVEDLPTGAPWYKALPDGMVYIGKVAYGYKGNMPENTTLTLRDGTVLIYQSAFAYQNHLAAVALPNSVTEIGSNAFYSCDGLTRIDIPESVKSIGAYAFTYDNGLTEVLLHEGLVSIERGAFRNCSRLKSVDIPDTVSSIADRAFYNCVSLESVDIPGSVSSIPDEVFYGCRDLRKATFHEGLTSIGYCAFRDCPALTEIVLPESLRTIDTCAFRDCSALKEITIPTNVTMIGESAFSYCSAMERGTVHADNPVYYSEGDCIIKKETKAVQAGGSASQLPDGVTAIVYNAFSGRTDLKKITIPSSVKSLSGFSGCTGLSSLDIPNSVTEIGEHAFSDCTGLTRELVIPDSVTYIGEYAFSGCDGLTGVRLSDQLTEIGSSAFRYCDGLTEIALPKSVKTIGGYAFENCKSLASVSLEEGLTSIGYGAFEGCDGLTEIAIPKSVSTIGGSAFAYCENLASVSLEEGLTSIGYGAFEGCDSLAGISIPASVTEIGYNAIPKYTVIYGRAGSYAETWARENNRAFTAPDEAYLTMYTAPVVNVPTAEACGFATPGAQVKLSLDGKEAATVTAAGSGHWSAVLPLTGAQDGDSLTLKAEVTYDQKAVSAEETVTYRPNAVVFKEFELRHSCYSATVNEKNLRVTVPNFTIVPGNPFAFRVAVSNSDRIEKLWVVSTENGVSKKMALAYNEVTGQWFSGEGFFADTDRDYVPGVFTVEGVDKDGKDFDCGVTVRFRFLIDPSGYVYEAVQSNKIEGATVSVCYKDEEGRELLWNAAEAGQTNPITTLADGAFAWDVPKGQWQVQVSKEGYVTAKSDWMDVPPEWKDVFLALETGENPTVKALYLCRDHADLYFSTYMDIDSVNTGTVVFDGYTGKIEPLDKTETAENSGVFYATAFRFTPDKPFADAVTVRLQEAAEADDDPVIPVPGETDGDENELGVWTKTYDYSDIKNYAGKQLYTCTGTFAVTEEPKDLSVGQTASVTYGKTAEITVSAANAAGRTVSVSCDSAILTLSQKTVTLDEEGKASVTVTGEMPGTAALTFALEGTDLTAAAEVTVVLPEKPDVMMGDVDGDGELTSGDARLALRASVKLESYGEDSAAYIAADVDRNGTIESSDARLILRASVKLEDPTKW